MEYKQKAMKYLITILVAIGFGILYCFLGVVGNQFLPEDVEWYSPTSVLSGFLAIIFACAVFITSVGIYTEIKQK